MAARSLIVVAALDLAENGGGATRARQLASLFSRAGNAVHLIGFGSRTADGFAGLDAEVKVECVPNPMGKIGRPLLGFLGHEGGSEGRRALIAAVQRRLETVQPKPLGVLLYNQDPALAAKLHRVCAAAGVLFLQQYAELHVAADYRARWLQGYYLRERRHFRKTPRLAAGNIVISSTLRKLAEGNGAKNILLLPSFVDAEFWESAIANSGRAKIPGRVLYAGEGARRDCLETVIAAAALCQAQGCLVALRLVGLSDDRRRDCMRRAEAAGIGAAVSATGRLNHAELAREYAEAAASILLRSDDRSSRACFPTRLGELLLTGRPVMLSDIPDYNVHLAHGESAYLANPRNVEDVARCLSEATAANERNLRIGAAGRDFARTRLNLNSYLTDVTRWLDDLDGVRHPASTN